MVVVVMVGAAVAVVMDVDVDAAPTLMCVTPSDALDFHSRTVSCPVGTEPVPLQDAYQVDSTVDARVRFERRLCAALWLNYVTFIEDAAHHKDETTHEKVQGLAARDWRQILTPLLEAAYEAAYDPKLASRTILDTWKSIQGVLKSHAADAEAVRAARLARAPPVDAFGASVGPAGPAKGGSPGSADETAADAARKRKLDRSLRKAERDADRIIAEAKVLPAMVPVDMGEDEVDVAVDLTTLQEGKTGGRGDAERRKLEEHRLADRREQEERESGAHDIRTLEQGFEAIARAGEDTVVDRSQLRVQELAAAVKHVRNINRKRNANVVFTSVPTPSVILAFHERGLTDWSKTRGELSATTGVHIDMFQKEDPRNRDMRLELVKERELARIRIEEAKAAAAIEIEKSQRLADIQTQHDLKLAQASADTQFKLASMKEPAGASTGTGGASGSGSAAGGAGGAGGDAAKQKQKQKQTSSTGTTAVKRRREADDADDADTREASRIAPKPNSAGGKPSRATGGGPDVEATADATKAKAGTHHRGQVGPVATPATGRRM